MVLTVGMYSAVQWVALHHYRAYTITTHYIHDVDRSLLTRDRTGSSTDDSGKVQAGQYQLNAVGGKVLVKH